jgi:hypothetical protein
MARSLAYLHLAPAVLLTALLLLALVVTVGCGGDDKPEPPEQPELVQMCEWLAHLAESAVVTADVSEDNLLTIGNEADALATEAGQIQVQGPAQLSLNQSVILLGSIEEASGDVRGLQSIPTYKGLLGVELEKMLTAVQGTYELPIDEAPCAAFDS